MEQKMQKNELKNIVNKTPGGHLHFDFPTAVKSPTVLKFYPIYLTIDRILLSAISHEAPSKLTADSS